MLFLFIGPPFVAGLVVLVVISALSFSISTCNLSLGEEVLRKKDQRLQASEELLGIIKFIKQNTF